MFPFSSSLRLTGKVKLWNAKFGENFFFVLVGGLAEDLEGDRDGMRPEKASDEVEFAKVN